VARLHAGVEDGHHDAATVELTPRLIGADERNALGKRRRVDLIDDHSFDPEPCRFEFSDGVGAHRQRQERESFVSAN
jgi:hypothetical protein